MDEQSVLKKIAALRAIGGLSEAERLVESFLTACSHPAKDALIHVLLSVLVSFAIDEGAPITALRYARALVEHFPSDAYSHDLMVDVCALTEDYELAIEHARIGLQLEVGESGENSENAFIARTRLAEVLLHAGRTSRCIEMLGGQSPLPEKLESAAQAQRAALLGRLAAETGDSEGAAENYRRAIRFFAGQGSAGAECRLRLRKELWKQIANRVEFRGMFSPRKDK